MKIDLSTCSGGTFVKLMDTVTRLGITDETAGHPVKTADQIVGLYCSALRGGHKAALKAAYTGGRFHVRTMSLDD